MKEQPGDLIRRMTIVQDEQGNLIDAARYAQEPDPNMRPLNKYDEGLTPYHSPENQEDIRAQNMTPWQARGNALVQGLTEVGLGTLEGVGYLLDLQQHVNIARGAEQEFSNWFSDLMKAGKEGVAEEFPVYGGEGFQPLNGRWWSKNFPSILSTLTLAVPTAGAVKGISTIGKGLLGAKALDATGKVAAKGITGALVSRYMENTMEASEVMRKVYDEKIAEGMSDADARQIAGQAASNAWYANLVNLATDIPQYMVMFGIGDDLARLGKIKNTKLGKVKELLSTAAGEALEEGIQYGIGEEAAKAGSTGETLSRVMQNFGEYFDDPDFLTSITLGAFGGALFSAASGTAKKVGEAPVKRIFDRLDKIQEHLRKGEVEQADKVRMEEVIDSTIEDDMRVEELIMAAEGENPELARKAKNIKEFTDHTKEKLSDDPLQVEKTKNLATQKVNQNLVQDTDRKIQEVISDPGNKFELKHPLLMEKNHINVLLRDKKISEKDAKTAISELNAEIKKLDPEYDPSAPGKVLPAGADYMTLSNLVKVKANARLENIQKQNEYKEMEKSPDKAIAKKVEEEKDKVEQDFKNDLEKVSSPEELEALKGKYPEQEKEVSKKINAKKREALDNLPDIEDFDSYEEFEKEALKEPFIDFYKDKAIPFLKKQWGKKKKETPQFEVGDRFEANDKVYEVVGKEGENTTFRILDDGSEITFTNEEIQTKLNAPTRLEVVDVLDLNEEKQDPAPEQKPQKKEVRKEKEYKVFTAEELPEGTFTYAHHQEEEGMEGLVNDTKLIQVKRKNESGRIESVWINAISEDGNPVFNNWRLQYEGSNLNPEEEMDKIRNFHKHYDINADVYLEAPQAPETYPRSGGDIPVTWENFLVQAVIYQDGKRIPLATIRSMQYVRGDKSSIAALRKELWTKMKASDGVVQAGRTVKIDTLRKGRWWNTRNMKSPKQAGYGDPVFGIAGSDGLIRTNFSKEINESEILGNRNVINTSGSPGMTYMLVPTPSGNHIWSKIFTKKIKEAPEVKEEIKSILNNAVEASRELKGFTESIPPADRAKRVREELAKASDKTALPKLKAWNENWKTYRTQIQEKVRWAKPNKKYDYEPDFNEKLIHVKSLQSDGVFDPDKFLDNRLNIDERLLRIDAYKINTPGYNESVDSFLETDLNVGTAFHSPSFLFTNYPVVSSSKEQKTIQEIPKEVKKKGIAPPKFRFAGGTVSTKNNKVSVRQTVESNITKSEMVALKKELSVEDNAEVIDRVEEEVKNQLNNKTSNKGTSLFQRIVSRIKKILLGLMILVQFNISTSFTTPPSVESKAYNNVKVENLQDWDNILVDQELINKLDNTSIIVEANKNSDESYLIVDKKAGMAHLYKGDNLLSSYEVGVGKKAGDEQTRTVVKNGKVYWEEGSQTTGAGIYQINKKGSFKNAPAYTLLNERGIEVPAVLHKTLEDRKKYFNNNNPNDNRMSYGCINFTGSSIQDLSEQISFGNKVYVLPDNPANHYRLVDGKLKFISREKNVNKSIGRYIPEPVFFRTDSPTKNQEEFLQYMSDVKTEIMGLYPTISNDLYNQISKIGYGIFGQETSFGTYGRVRGQIGRITDIGGAALEKNVSAGITQIRVTSINKKVREHFNINAPSDLFNDKKAAIATISHLLDIYINQIPSSKKSEFKELLPLGYNNPADLRRVLKGDKPVKNIYVKKVLENADSVTAYISDNFNRTSLTGAGDFRFKVANDIVYKELDVEQAKVWFKKVLPDWVEVEIVDGLVKINGVNAWGATKNGLIKLSDIAKSGTEYHEAFHVVFNNILSPDERSNLLRIAKRKIKLTKNDVRSAQRQLERFIEANAITGIPIEDITAEDLAYEEKLADAFMEYQMTGETSLGFRIKRFFDRLLELIRLAFGFDATIEGTFARIGSGDFKNKPFYGNKFYRFQAKPEFSVKELEEVKNISLNLLDRAVQELGGELKDKYLKALSNNPEKNMLLSTTEGSVITYLKYIHDNEIENPNTQSYLRIIQGLRPDVKDMDLNTEGTPRVGPLYVEMIKGLATRGFKVRMKDGEMVGGMEFSQGDELIEFDENQDTREQWQVAQFSVSPSEKLSARLKRFLSNLVRTDRTGNLIQDSMGMGIPLYYSGKQAYAKLQQAIGDSYSPIDMFSKIQEKASQDTFFDQVLAQVIDYENNYEHNLLLTELWVSIGQKNHPEFRTILQVKEKGKTEIRAINANQHTLSKSILNDLFTEYKKERAEKAAETFKGILNPPGARGKKIRETKTFNEAEIERIKKGLDYIGFSIDPDIIEKAATTSDLFNIVKELIPALESKKEFGEAFRQFVEELKPYYSQTYQDAHMNVEGKRQYEWINSSYIGKLISKLTTSYGEVSSLFKKDPLYNNLIYLNRDPKAKFVVVDGVKMHGRSEGRQYENFSEADLWMSLLGLYINQNSPGRAIYSLPVLSDSSVMAGVELPKDTNVDRIVKQLVELARFDFLREARELKQDVRYNKEYHFFPEILKGMKEFDEVIVANELRKHISAKKDTLIDTLKRVGILKIQDGKLVGTDLFDSRINNPETFIYEFLANHMLAHGQLVLLTTGDPAFYKNLGDYYKRAKEVWSPGQLGNPDAFYDTPGGQRVRVPQKMKTKIVKDIEKKAIQYDDIKEALEKVAPQKAKEILKQYENVSWTDGQTYIDLVSLRWREIANGRWNDLKQAAFDILISGGAFNSEANNKLRKARKEAIKKATGEEKKNLERIRIPSATEYQPYKPYYYNLTLVNDILLPIQKKDSEMIIIPEYGNTKSPLHNPFFKDILEDMGYQFETDGSVMYLPENRKADVVTTSETMKVAKWNVSDYEKDGIGEDYIELDFNEWRIQQEVPEHHKETEGLFGIQIMKLITADVDPEGSYTAPDGRKLSGKDLIEEYNKLIIEDIEASYDALVGRISGATPQETFDNLVRILKDEVIDRGLGDQYLEALEQTPNQLLDSIQNTALPLWHPLHAYRIESMLNSLFKKNVTKQKFSSGYTFVNASSYGFKNPPKIVFRSDGSIAHIEAYAPIYDKRLYKYLNSDGYVDVAAVEEKEPELLRGIVYRIPTEDKYSMFNIKVIGFTPDDQGVIFLPHEVTAMAGLDFDVDKVYGFFYGKNPYRNILDKLEEQIDVKSTAIGVDEYTTAFENIFSEFTEFEGLESEFLTEILKDLGYTRSAYEELKKNAEYYDRKVASDNKKLDLMRTVLESPLTTPSILTPGGFERVRAYNKTILEKQSFKEVTDYLDPATLVEIAQRMKLGKELIGVAAVNNSVHAIMQRMDLTLNYDIKFNGADPVKNLNRIKDDKGNLISRNFAELLAAFVDNGKDPQASYFNMNLYTADAAMMLLHAGVDLETVMYFLAQPKVKEFVRDYYNGGGTYQTEQDLMGSDKYKHLELNKLRPNTKVREFSTGDLKNNLSGGDSQFQNDVLKAFLVYKNIGMKVGQFVRAVKAGDSGVGPTQAKNVKTILDREQDFNTVISGASQALEQNNYANQFYKTGIRKANKFILDHAGFPDMTTGNIGTLFEKISQYKSGNNLTEREMEDLYRSVFDYFASGYEFFKFDDDIATSLPEEINKLKSDNAFLKRLSVDRGYITFRAITGNDNTEIDNIRNAWKELYNEPDTRDLAIKLAKYSFFTNGFRMGIGSFSHLQPVAIYRDMPEFNNHMAKIMSTIQYESDQNVDMFKNFYDQYVKNNFINLSWVKSVRFDDSGTNVDVVKFKERKPVLVKAGDEFKYNAQYRDEEGKLVIYRDFLPHIKFNYKGDYFLFEHDRAGVYKPITPLSRFVGRRKEFQTYDMNNVSPRNYLVENVNEAAYEEARVALGVQGDTKKNDGISDDTPLNDDCNGL